MAGDHLDDLAALIAVAEERSFTRAATRLGISQVGAEPDGQELGVEAWHPPAESNDAQRIADAGR
jgi:hypothetical protein